MNAGLTDGAAQATIIDVTYEVTCQTADYLSILITKHTKRPDSESTTISGHVFALTGSRAGEIISLPYLLGILTQDGKVDTWLARPADGKSGQLRARAGMGGNRADDEIRRRAVL